MSNIITFPGRNPAPLGAPSFEYGRPVEVSVERSRRRAGPNMHTFVFRSYDLILASPEVDLVRDVRCDIHKAATKLKAIRQQLQRDREHAAAREDILTKAEAKLAAALGAAMSSKSAEG